MAHAAFRNEARRLRNPVRAWRRRDGRGLSRAPAHIRTILTRCLEKNRQARFADISIVKFLLQEGSAIAAGSSAGPGGSKARAIGTTAAAAFATGIIVAAAIWAPWRKASPTAPLRLEVGLGADASLVTNQGAAAILSPDGQMLAFVAQKSGGSPQLYVRRLEQLQATPLSGTDDAFNPFFSPDGQWIAFFTGAKLKKISVAGGAALTLCDAAVSRGGSWGEDGTIVFEPAASSGTMLWRVSAAGGKPEPFTTLAEGEATQRYPQVLPGGKAVLYMSRNSTGGNYDDANLVVQPLPTGARKIVQRGAYYGRYVPSGHLVYIHDGTLFAAPFDLDRLEVTGQAVPALEGVLSGQGGGAQFALSATGTLVYLPGGSTTTEAPIVWMDHTGKTTPLRALPASWRDPQFAPDGRRLAMNIVDAAQNDVWVYEWARDTLTRLTFDAAPDSKPVWTPDGRRIVFSSMRGDKRMSNLYWQRADGTGDVQRLTESKNQQFPGSWHPSGKFLAFSEINPQTAGDLMILPMEGDETSGWKPGKPTVFLNSPFGEYEPMFSPDGRWLAYVSNELGRDEVYVRPFPGPGGKWQISTGGGTWPTWSRARHELFFATPDQRIMLASYTVEGDSFRADKPRLWSEARFAPRPGLRNFDLHPDGERVAVAPAQDSQTTTKQDKVVFIFNFFDELRRVAPRAK